jgi:hypothetical protein
MAKKNQGESAKVQNKNTAAFAQAMAGQGRQQTEHRIKAKGILFFALVSFSCLLV